MQPFQNAAAGALFSLFCAAAPSVALAQGIGEASPEIVVTGAALPEAQSQPNYSVVTIGADRLRVSASGRIEDVLRDQAGMQQFRRSDARSAHPTSQGAGIRGLGGNAASRVLVLLDGAPVADPFGGWIDWPALDPRSLESVKVTRGGGASAFGAGALAGTIEMSSLSAESAPILDAGIAVGSRGSLSGDARGKIAAPGGFAILSARIDHGDGFIPVRPDQRGAADISAPYDQWSGRARYVAALRPDIEAQIALSAFGDARARGTPFSGNDSNGQDLSVRLLGRGHWAWEALAYAQNRSFQSEFAAVAAGRTSASTSLNQFKTPAKGYGAKFEIRPPLGQTTELRLGADYRRVEGDTNEFFSYANGTPRGLRKAGGENETVGAFAELSLFPLERLSLTASARGDYWRIENGYLRETVLAPPVNPRNLVGADRDDFEGLGRVGASYALTDKLSLRAAAYQGYRLPTLNELYRPFRAGADGTAANLNLDPEKLKGAEIGLEAEPIDKLKLGVTIFWNVLDGAIANVSNAKLPGDICPGVGVVSGACRQRQNLDRIESNGVEIDASYAFGAWTIAGAYNFADAEVKGSGLTGLRPAQIPEHQGSVTLGWMDTQGLQASMTGRYVSSQFDDDQNARRLSSAASLDAYFSAPLRDDLKLELRGENITGASIEAARSGFGVIEEAAPRTLWVGLRYSLR